MKKITIELSTKEYESLLKQSMKKNFLGVDDFIIDVLQKTKLSNQKFNSKNKFNDIHF